MNTVIAHRGNTHGRIPERENHPDYILRALSLGYEVEVDVWYVDDKLFLGHDAPQYPICRSFLDDRRLWIHCKNVEVMAYLSDDVNLNIFAHKDDIVITTQGFLWTAPVYPITPKSIAVMPCMVEDWDISEAFGVCTDNPSLYKE